MSDILCIYYSRTGHTRRAIKEIAAALDAEVAAVSDERNRSGWRGYVRSGLDAMRRSSRPLRPIRTERPIDEYPLIIVGTPVWAGRCASPIRAFLKRHGMEAEQLAYVLTRDGSRRYEEVYEQMDLYTEKGHLFAVSLKPGSEGYTFWRDQFIGDVQRYMEQNHAK